MARQPQRERKHHAGDCEQRAARRRRLDIEAENILEIGEPVIAAEAEIVAEEAEHQREGERLGDDRQIDAGDAAAERKPAEHEGEHAGHQHHHQGRIGETIEAVPVDRQFRPVQEHHEVGPDRVGIDAAGADLAHQIHAHGVAAEREERAVAEREDAAIAPDQVDRERQHARSRHICPTATPDRSAPGTASCGGNARLSSGTTTASASRIATKIRVPRSKPRPRSETTEIMPPPPGP